MSWATLNILILPVVIIALDFRPRAISASGNIEDLEN